MNETHHLRLYGSHGACVCVSECVSDCVCAYIKVCECVCMRVCMHVNESMSTRVYVKVCECVCVLLKVVPDGSRKESQSQRFPW